MPSTNLKKKSQRNDFEKKYYEIVGKSKELNCNPLHLNLGKNFKKFSLYKESPNSITSFNTNASL